MAETDSLRQIAHSRAPFSVWLGTILLFVIFGAIVLAVIGPSPRKDDYEATRAKKRVDNLKALRTEDAKALTTYAWVDKAKGTVRIPIDRAMQLMVTELAQKKPAPAYAIAVVPSTPAAAPSAAPSAAPKSGANPPAAPAAPSQTSSAANPPNPQPGASAIPLPSPAAGKPAVSPTSTPTQKPSAPPLPVPGTTPTP